MGFKLINSIVQKILNIRYYNKASSLKFGIRIVVVQGEFMNLFFIAPLFPIFQCTVRHQEDEEEEEA